MAIFSLMPNILTSNTSNPPYVVSATYETSSNFAWKAFDGTTTTYWVNGASGVTGYKHSITIDLGESLPCNGVSVTQSNSTNYFVKKFKLSGSHNNVDFQDLFKNTSDAVQTVNTPTFFEFDNTVAYRYYKFQPLTGTSSFCRIGELSIHWDTERASLDGEDNVSCSYANLTYTLPMNTTANILAKKLDGRAGLLGMANDPDNFGDLYVVGRDGKAHLTKSGIKSEVIFSGSANSGAITISKNLNEFKYIVVEADNGTLVTHPIVYVETMYETSNTKTLLTKTTDTSLTINQGFNMTIKKVIGIY